MIKLFQALLKSFFENDGYVNISAKETLIDFLLEKGEDKYDLWFK